MKSHKKIMQEADNNYNKLKWYEKMLVPRSLFTIDSYLKIKRIKQ